MPLEELKAILRYRKVSYRELAKVIGVQVSTFSNKINGRKGSDFTTTEVLAIAKHLDFTPDELVKYFFSSMLA